jgi:peptide/nickel transport system permease protein
MSDTATIEETGVNVDQSRKEAYFTAGQGQLIWARFKKQRAAMIGGAVLIALILSGFFAPFLTPYDPTIEGRNPDYQNGAPNIPKLSRSSGMKTGSRRDLLSTATSEPVRLRPIFAG